MKYSKTNKPIECIMKNSTCYKGTTVFKPKGVLWHSTGANNTNISRYVQPHKTDSNYDEMVALLGKNKYNNDWNHIVLRAGVNAFIGKLADGTVAAVQTLPWDYAPWGCGKGSKGTCNDTHIQFEIAEDNLSNKDYFDKIYKEACELTAYLCYMYDIDPYGTISYNGVTVPTILCHADSYKLGLGSNHGDVVHWFKKYGKTMEDVRDDVAAIMKKNVATTPTTTTKTLYRIRKDWSNAASQVGAFTDLENAKKACDVAGSQYNVYDETGKVVYPVAIDFNDGEQINLSTDAKYINGKDVPDWVLDNKLYYRGRDDNGNIIFSTLKTGLITGVVDKKYVSKIEAFKPYLVQVTASSLNIRGGVGTGYSVVGTITNKGTYTIVEEAVAKNGNKWGLLKAYEKNRNGWIALSYTKKV